MIACNRAALELSIQWELEAEQEAEPETGQETGQEDKMGIVARPGQRERKDSSRPSKNSRRKKKDYRDVFKDLEELEETGGVEPDEAVQANPVDNEIVQDDDEVDTEEAKEEEERVLQRVLELSKLETVSVGERNKVEQSEEEEDIIVDEFTEAVTAISDPASPPLGEKTTDLAESCVEITLDDDDVINISDGEVDTAQQSRPASVHILEEDPADLLVGTGAEAGQLPGQAGVLAARLGGAVTVTRLGAGHHSHRQHSILIPCRFTRCSISSDLLLWCDI